MCVEKLNATDIAGSGRSAATGGGSEFTTAVVFLCLISIILVVLVGVMLSQVLVHTSILGCIQKTRLV